MILPWLSSKDSNGSTMSWHYGLNYTQIPKYFLLDCNKIYIKGLYQQCFLKDDMHQSSILAEGMPLEKKFYWEFMLIFLVGYFFLKFPKIYWSYFPLIFCLIVHWCGHKLFFYLLFTRDVCIGDWTKMINVKKTEKQ